MTAIRTLFLALAFCLSASNAYCIDYVVDIATLECPFANINASTSKSTEYTAEVDGITWKLVTRRYTYDQSAKYLRISTATAADNDQKVTLTFSGFNGTINAVEATCWRTADQKGVNPPTLTVNVGNEAFGVNNITHEESTLEFSGQASGDIVLTFTQPSTKKTYGIYIGKIKISYSTNNNIALDKAADNSTVLESNKGSWANVTLNRNFTNDGWYTLCLPFALDATGIDAAFGEETQVEEFTSVTTTNGESQLVFSPVSDGISAGVPYLIAPTKADINSITFNGVKITSDAPATVEHEGYKFIGTYSATKMTTESNYKLLGGSDGSVISNISKDGTLNGTHCYFEFPSLAQNVNRHIAIGYATAIKPLTDTDNLQNNAVYTLQGIKVKDASHLPSGIYIRNGKKIIVR